MVWPESKANHSIPTGTRGAAARTANHHGAAAGTATSRKAGRRLTPVSPSLRLLPLRPVDAVNIPRLAPRMAPLSA